MLDVVVTCSHTTPPRWVAQAKASVREAARWATFPTNLVVQEGVPGSVLAAMKAGLKQCTSEYVAWVDDDDFLLPSALREASDHLRGGAQGVFLREIQIHEGLRTSLVYDRHHLSIFRREYVARAIEHAGEKRPLMDLLREAQGVDVMDWVYVRRMWDSAGSQIRKQARLRHEPVS